MKKTKSSILFISPVKSSFVMQDIEILSKTYQVISFFYKPGGFCRSILSQFFLLVFIFKNILLAQKIFIWFCDYHSFLPSLLGRLFDKRIYIVLGGYDAIKLDKYNYGAHLKKTRSLIIKLTCKLATIVLPVSRFTFNEALNNIGHFLQNKMIIIYNAVDTKYFFPNFSANRQYIITVAYVNNYRNFKIKGLEKFCELAKEFPEKKFCIVGVSPKMLLYFKKLNISNLKLVQPLSKEEMRNFYWQTKIICQFSEIESFGLSVAEAMACGCIPLVSKNGALPEIVFSQNTVETNLDFELIKNQFLSLLQKDNNDIYISKIKKFFPISLRTKKLMSIMES